MMFFVQMDFHFILRKISHMKLAVREMKGSTTFFDEGGLDPIK